MEVPSRPWETLEIDSFLHISKLYLLVADYYSKFSWVQNCLPLLLRMWLLLCISNFQYLILLGKSSVTMACNSPAGSKTVCYPVKIHNDYKQYSLHKRSWFHWKAGTDHQEDVQQMWWGWFKLTDGSMWVEGNLHYSKKPLPGKHLQSRQLKTTLPVIIKPPHNNEVVRASFQARQDYNRHNVYTKENSHLLATQPMWVQTTNDGRWSQCGDI